MTLRRRAIDFSSIVRMTGRRSIKVIQICAIGRLKSLPFSVDTVPTDTDTDKSFRPE